MISRTILIRMKNLNGSIACDISSQMKTVQDLIGHFLQTAFTNNNVKYIDNSYLVRLRKPFQETIIQSLDEIEMNDVLVYRPCEELRKLLEEGCITPVLQPSRFSPRDPLDTFVISNSPTQLPCLKRKARSNSFVIHHKNLDLCRERLCTMAMSRKEKLHIEELMKAEDEQVLDAFEQNDMSQGVKTLRRMLHGPELQPRLEALDRLSSTFATLNVEPSASSTSEDERSSQCLPKTRSSNSLFIGRPSLSLDTFEEHSHMLGQLSSSTNKRPVKYLDAIQEGAQSVASFKKRPFELELSVDVNLLGTNKLTCQYPPYMSIANMLDNIPVGQDIYTKYDIGQHLGSGKYSVVKECRDKQNGQLYAVKIVDKYQIMESRFLKRELEIMHSIRYDGIVCLVELFETADQLFIVMERCNRELFECIDREGPLKEDTARKLMQKLVSTVAYLHKKEIVHRDIKPENILICGSDVSDIKLTDFGIARKLDGCNGLENLTPHDTLADVTGHRPSAAGANETIRNRVSRAHTKCGTRDYVAPEVMSGKGYSTEADMWSIGIVTYVIMSGCSPIFLPTPAGPTICFLEDIWKQISPEAKSFIEQATAQEPENRLTASHALKHPWLQMEGLVL